MRSALVRLVFCFTAVTVCGVVRGDLKPFILEADYFVEVSGTNADGSGIFISRDTSPTGIQDFSSIKFGDSFKGSTDDGDGFATVDFAGFATYQDKNRLLGARISGSSSFLRIPFVSAGGEIEAAGEIRLAYQDFITIDVPEFNSPEPVIIEGFLKLHGSMDASSSKTGSFTQGGASAGVEIRGTGIGPNKVGSVFQRAGEPKGSLGLENINVFPFTIAANTFVPEPLEFAMTVRGSALTSSTRGIGSMVGTAAAAFNANFENTLEWGGITSVTRASTGEPITDWSVTSESGFDYSQFFPVPEPSVLALLLTAAAAATLRRRRPNRIESELKRGAGLS